MSRVCLGANTPRAWLDADYCTGFRGVLGQAAPARWAQTAHTIASHSGLFNGRTLRKDALPASVASKILRQ